MPIYEYQCTNCGHQLEAFQKISEDPLKICPKCQGSSLTKLISATNFQLKGTGWYATDFRNKNTPDTKPADDKESAASEVKKDANSTNAKGADQPNTVETPSASKAPNTGTDSSSKAAK